MNILYISRVKGVPWAGPTYSVPAQIEAQRNYDNVLWYNIVEHDEPYAREWLDKTGWQELSYYCDLTDYPNQKLNQLPFPFSNPDLIIVEQFYGYAGFSIISEIIKNETPYIIIPRGELTKSAQKSKRLKKKIGNTIIFNRFARKAEAIQYLTTQEKIDSGKSWNKNALVIPNGMESSMKKTSQQNDIKEIKFISIGRLDPYHKGLDLLIQACSLIKNELRNNNCSIKVFGPDRVGKLDELIRTTQKNEIEDILSFEGPLYGEEKKDVMLDSNAFVITSRFEGHPMALIEAMDYGLPCIATTGCNMREEIDAYEAGWTADCTADSIAEAFIKAIESIHEFKKYSENAIKLASNYEWQKLAKHSHELYVNLLN